MSAPAVRLAVAVALGAWLGGCGNAPPTAVGESDQDPRKSAVVRFWQLYDAATALRLQQDYAGAARTYEEALSLDPRHEDSLYYLGWCRRELGLFAEARQAYEKLVAVSPQSARGHLALGALLAAPDPEAPLALEEAERRFRRAHEINAEETGPMVRLGEIRIVRGDFREARTWLEAAAQTNPKSVEAAFLSGYLRWEAGDPDGAGAFYVRALRASRSEAPIRGVLSEGDRQPAEGDSRRPPPPLAFPMGETLFGHLCPRPAASEVPESSDPPSRSELERIYQGVREFSAAVALRSAPRPGARPADSSR